MALRTDDAATIQKIEISMKPARRSHAGAGISALAQWRYLATDAPHPKFFHDAPSGFVGSL